MFKNSKVLVTGGAGFIGVNLIKRLLSEGANIRATLHSKGPVIIDDRVDYIKGDLRLEEFCTEAVDGVDYIFVSKDDFSHKMKNEQYLEHAEVHGNYYGTLVDSVVKLIEKNILVILEIDYQGAEIIKEKLPLSRNIFVLPPSLSELEKRLRERGTDSEKVILERLQNAKNELNQAHCYDYILVNDNFELAEQRLLSYVLDVNMLIDEKIRKEPLIDTGF